MDRLTELTIEGLRGVGRVELRFALDQRVFTLFGSNGVGKTKCLEALYLFLLLNNRTYLNEIGNWPVLPDAMMMQSIIDSDGHTFRKFTDDGQIYPLPRDQAGKFSDNDLPVLFLGAINRSLLESSQQQMGFRVLATFAERRRQYFEEVHQAIQEKKLSNLGMNEDVQNWFIVRAQSDNPYQKASSRRNVEIDTVMEMLHEIDNRINPESLQIDGNTVSLKIKEDERKLDELSSGFMSLVKLVQAIIAGYANFTNETNLRYVKGIVLIDEIESHLHVQWQSSIVSKLKKLLPNTIFYIATHSPIVLSQLEQGEAYLLEREDDGVVRSHEISWPNRRLLSDVLKEALHIDLNKLKRQNMERGDQTKAKQALLDWLRENSEAGKGDE